MISRESLAQYAGSAVAPAKNENGGRFDMDGYLSEHGFEVIGRKPWQSHPGGLIYELAYCPFNGDHTGGSAAFTLTDGKPGFRCQHDGCKGKTIKDVFAAYPVQSVPAANGGDEAATADGRRKASQSQLLIELAANAELFQTPDGEAFAAVPVGDHRETWPVKSKGCRRWFTGQFYEKHRKPPSSQAMQDALGVLEARAQFESPTFPIFTRVAPTSNGIYIDLCNDGWEVVEITPEGWRIVRDPPVRFRRAKGMLALPYPAVNASIAKLRSLINIGDDNNWILLLSWLVAACRPTGPYPLLILQGEQGSAKSTTAKMLRRIIDPSAALVRTPPREDRDLLIAAKNSWVVAFDNLSGIPQWLSDALCRLATGGGFSTRELYTDSDQVFFDAERPVILNGIDHLAERADLADRAVTIMVPRIEDSARRDEAELYAEFERELPGILGALFTAVSAALARLPETKLNRKPRMADFALWATAVEESLGFKKGAFMDAYGGNRAESIQETLDADPVAIAVRALMEEGESWDGISKELLQKLEKYADEPTRKSAVWPKTPRALSGRLRRLVTVLREGGNIEIMFPEKKEKGAKGRREMSITRISLDSTASTAATATVNGEDEADRYFGDF